MQWKDRRCPALAIVFGGFLLTTAFFPIVVAGASDVAEKSDDLVVAGEAYLSTKSIHYQLPPPADAISPETSYLSAAATSVAGDSSSTDQLTNESDSSTPPSGNEIPSDPAEDAVDPGNVTSTTPAGSKRQGQTSSQGSGDPLYYMIPLGIYADTEFCNQVSDWNLQLLKIVQDVNSVYNTHLNTRLLKQDGPRCIPGSDAWSNDANYGPGKLFTQYSQWCAGDSGCSAVRNALGIAHLISGKNLVQGSQDIIGAGDEPGTFSVIEALYQWLTSYTRKVLASHEMGHNLWGDHGYHESW